MVQLLPTTAVFVEERFIRNLFCSRLSTICSTRASIPHVEVAQDFQAYVQQLLPKNVNARQDSEIVLKLLNDDGQGVNNMGNTAVGYRLSRAADLFKKIQMLPADMLDVPAYELVDMPARFNAMFTDAQMRIDAKPLDTGNHIQDMVTKLRHVNLVIKAILDFVEYPLESNARTVYSVQTKQQYDDIRVELKQTLTEANKQVTQTAKIIERYAATEIVKTEKVALRAVNGLFVTANLHLRNELVAIREHVDGWESFDIQWLGDNKVALRAFNNLFVQSHLEQGGELLATRQDVQGWETFTIHYFADKKVALQAYNHLFVSCHIHEQCQLVADSPEAQKWEFFDLIFL